LKDGKTFTLRQERNFIKRIPSRGEEVAANKKGYIKGEGAVKSRPHCGR